jgi:hypothetical protein
MNNGHCDVDDEDGNPESLEPGEARYLWARNQMILTVLLHSG